MWFGVKPKTLFRLLLILTAIVLVCYINVVLIFDLPETPVVSAGGKNHVPLATGNFLTAEVQKVSFRPAKLQHVAKKEKVPQPAALSPDKQNAGDPYRLFLEQIRSIESKVIPGAGENGVAVTIGDSEEKLLAEKLQSKNGFNVVVSDKISLNRTIPDNRHVLCSKERYDDELPNVSLIITFINEAWSTLLRTIWSVINRTPTKYLLEIILIDDFSDRHELKGQLNTYMKTKLPSYIQLIRLEQRHGLIKARLIGAKHAKGDVLVFLDSHCEVNYMWLQPLLQRIKYFPSTVVTPIIEIINENNFEIIPYKGEYFQIGSFSWNGNFNWMDISERIAKTRKSSISPTPSPTMAGGIFAIDRRYFFHIGAYDPLMDIWGGENLELSFRVWMCGGSIEIIPCSIVGHVFREFHPYSFNGNNNAPSINTLRMAKVWMDDYQRLLFLNHPQLLLFDSGDLSERQKLRRQLHCNNFHWYLKNVIPEKFILDEDSLAFGRLSIFFIVQTLFYIPNLIYIMPPCAHNKGLCLDILGRLENEEPNIGLNNCQFSQDINQYFSYSRNRELRRENTCAQPKFIEYNKPAKIILTKCTNTNIQKWMHFKNGPIVNMKTKICLDISGLQTSDDILGKPCNQNPGQRWNFDYYISDIKF